MDWVEGPAQLVRVRGLILDSDYRILFQCLSDETRLKPECTIQGSDGPCNQQHLSPQQQMQGYTVSWVVRIACRMFAPYLNIFELARTCFIVIAAAIIEGLPGLSLESHWFCQVSFCPTSRPCWDIAQITQPRKREEKQYFPVML